MEYVNSLLIAEDIEGLIALGAPLDEYVSEAKMIADATASLTADQFNEEHVIAIIALAWATFELSPDELELRLPSIVKVARNILNQNHV